MLNVATVGNFPRDDSSSCGSLGHAGSDVCVGGVPHGAVLSDGRVGGRSLLKCADSVTQHALRVRLGMSVWIFAYSAFVFLAVCCLYWCDLQSRRHSK